jgi:pyrophosphatase PpaX
VLKAALFDFDGTLVDTTELIYQSMRHATGEVLGKNLPREILLANVGQPLPRQMELIDAERAEALLESYRIHNEEHHDALIGEFPGVKRALARLHAAGVRVAVVTSKRCFSVKMALKRFPGLGETVDRFVTMEDTTEHKPDPEPLLKGLEFLGDIPPQEAAYVGDSPFDVAAANAAGVFSIAVGWGNIHPRERIEAEHPGAYVETVDELLELL